ncbi:hypothetical protein Hypma_007255 [Hypsizygus marmoreus]|uniref:Uncharacterized protein n=1 Tax=Hypsizygus marmoreus TaxID=39966 RepID=A0A369KAM6_HYPMA|nr:hypothetical protein Hypma_007255 [Hypsizygus marmoreus]
MQSTNAKVLAHTDNDRDKGHLRPLPTGNERLYAMHDGKVHNPLGAGSYIYKKEYIASHIRYLGLPTRNAPPGQALPPSILFIHIGAQPNNSPHAGTITVFILAFLIAREIKRYYEVPAGSEDGVSVELQTWINDFQVVVQLDLVDTAPHNEEGCTYEGIQYQRSQRFTKAHHGLLPDYEEVMCTAAAFVGGEIRYVVRNQETLTSLPSMPVIIDAMIRDRERLGLELAPETGGLAMRRACPHEGCGLAEKHGRKNKYSFAPSGAAVIEFHCPEHGYHSVMTSEHREVATLEFNTPLRNLVRAFAYGIDTARSRAAAFSKESGGEAERVRVHMRVTGADYTGTYSDQLLWRQLMLMSMTEPVFKGIAPPVIAYAPLIQDWAGSKLSKSLYVENGAYEYLKERGMGYMVSFAEMKRQGRDQRILYREVETWVEDPKKLFRPYSIDYLHRVFEEEKGKE